MPYRVQQKSITTNWRMHATNVNAIIRNVFHFVSFYIVLYCTVFCSSCILLCIYKIIKYEITQQHINI